MSSPLDNQIKKKYKFKRTIETSTKTFTLKPIRSLHIWLESCQKARSTSGTKSVLNFIHFNFNRWRTKYKFRPFPKSYWTEWKMFALIRRSYSLVFYSLFFNLFIDFHVMYSISMHMHMQYAERISRCEEETTKANDNVVPIFR